METESLIIICILSCAILLGFGISQIREDIAEIKKLIKK